MTKSKNQTMSTADAIKYFDSLGPIMADEMLGFYWRGEGIDTDHPMDGMLESSRWWGKMFKGPDDVHPLIHKGLFKKRFSVNPALLPIRLATHLPLRDVLGPVLFPPLSPLASTRKPKARLRMMEFRGKLSAAMCYDAKPINDCFRKIDEDTVIGWMDFKGMDQPYFFKLFRDEPV
ncbi:MAG: DUF4334 domain-containing protein [Acidimicrobiales bacterium]|nr:DUF4334 domain-containing protein [Hyphomonadaceae bacterium]RZV42358.1 MAG: DUF4334 domain-containing protein [Acidimicrobiales bacterium]